MGGRQERFQEKPAPGPEGASRRPDVLARLEQAVGAIQDSETFRRYLDVQARFHQYSFGNVVLILSQRPDSTKVAGYNAWLKMHRYVKRGETAIKIIVPMTKKVENDSGEVEYKRIFGTGNVFDISQTDGEDLPTVAVPELTGQEGSELLMRLSAVAMQDGLLLEQATPSELRGEQMGYYDRHAHKIVVRQAAPLQMAKTMAHELAHHFAGHEKSDAESETVAEASAYVVLSHFGLDSGERSFPYIAVWSQDQKRLRSALGTIQQVSAQVIGRVEGQRAEGEQLPPLDQ